MRQNSRTTVFKRLSVFINNEGSFLLFSKGVHWEAKNSLKIFAFPTIFVIISPDTRIGGTEGILMLFGKLFKTAQYTFGSVCLSLRTLLFQSSDKPEKPGKP